MIKLAAISALAFVLSLAALGLTYAQTESPSPTTTATPSPTTADESSMTVPEGAPQTGFGGF